MDEGVIGSFPSRRVE